MLSNFFFITLFTFLQVYFEAALLLVETLVTIPTLIYLKRTHERAARLGIIISASAYVYSVSETMGLPYSVYHYYLALIPMAAIFYNENERSWKFAGVMVPVFTCLFQALGPDLQVSFVMPAKFPYEVFRIITFLGAGSLIYAFLDEFKRVNQNARELDQFFSVSQDLLCIVNTSGHFTKVNPAFGKILGYSEYELLANSFMSFIHPDDVSATREDFNSLCRRDKGLLQFEARWKCKDGSVKYLSWSSTTDLPKGSIYAAVIDMTTIRTQESQLRQTMEAINRSAIVAVTDRAGIIKSVNENFCRISGYSKEELIGQNHRILKSGIHSDQYFRELWKTIASGKVWSGEIQNRSKNNEIYTVHTVISPIFDMNGKVESYLSIRFDVTQLKESQQRLEEAQRVAKIGSWTLDLNDKHFHWSKQMFKFFPEIKETVFQIPYDEFLFSINPEDQNIWEEAIEKCLKDGEAFRIRFRTKVNEKQRWIEAIGYPQIAINGTDLTLSGTCQDLTELVEAEEATKLERAKSLHSAKLASLGELSAGVAHEINNPLAIISGTASLIPDILDDREKVMTKVQKIEKACERISKIVFGLRKFSRTTDKQDYHPHSINKILEEVLILTDAKSKKFATPIMVNSRTPGIIFCSDIEIEQVLVNLVNNGIDAVREQDERWVKIEVFDEPGEVILRVIDSGHGIPQNVVKKLFQPFFTTKPVGEGTGLGLSITKGILDSHKASIEIKTIDNHTCFEIRFKNAEELLHVS